MDWGSFAAYVAVLVNIVILSLRFSQVQGQVRTLNAKMNFLVFIHSELMEGKDPEEVRRTLHVMGREAQEALKFAEIARRESRPWWRRLIRL